MIIFILVEYSIFRVYTTQIVSPNFRVTGMTTIMSESTTRHAPQTVEVS